MVAAQTGWWLNGVPGVRPAPSQVALLRSLAGGSAVVELSPGAVRRVEASALPLRITMPRIDLPGGPAVWAGLRDVPAGRFELRLTAPRPIGGALTVRAGFSREPVQVLSLPRQSAHRVPFDLAAGTTDLRFVPDEALAAGQGTLELWPRLLAPGPFVPARARLQVDTLDVYVFGGAPFVEDRAIWVRGGGGAHLAIASRDAGPRTVTIRLVNGPSANPVVVSIAGETQRIDLEASASAVVPVVLDGEGAASVLVTSPSGFRPSDDGQSADRRYLGVRVEFGDASRDAPPTVDQ